MPARGALDTLGHLLARWSEKDPRLAGRPVAEGRKLRKPLSPATIRFYRGAVRLIERLDDADWWALPLAQCSARKLGALLDRAEICHGLHQARAVRATLQAAFKWGLKEGRVARNPMRLIEDTLPVPAPRVRAATVAEVRALIAAADASRRPEIGDAVALAVFTGLRQADRLKAKWTDIEAGVLTAAQNKKGGEALALPLAGVVTARLRAAKARRGILGNVAWPQLVIDETANAPFRPDWYRKLFREVRDLAAMGGIIDLTEQGREGSIEIEPCPSLADLRDQDLRDTALSWVVASGGTDMEAGNLSGHAFAGRRAVLRHYVANDLALARATVARVEAWFNGQAAAKEG